MDKIICGELEFNNNKYYFNFRNNILVIQPEKMEDYSKWWFSFLGKEMSMDKRVNVEGETNEGKYICFVDVKFSQLGRGNLQAFVPAYVLGDGNSVSPLPKCINIEKDQSYVLYTLPKEILNKDNNLLITIMSTEKDMKNVTEIFRNLI